MMVRLVISSISFNSFALLDFSSSGLPHLVLQGRNGDVGLFPIDESYFQPAFSLLRY
jgi:hypothetical protein